MPCFTLPYPTTARDGYGEVFPIAPGLSTHAGDAHEDMRIVFCLSATASQKGSLPHPFFASVSAGMPEVHIPTYLVHL